MIWRRSKTCGLVLVAGLTAGSPGCAVNPATGARELSLVSESQEIAMGRQADPAITGQMGGLYGDSALQRYVRDIGLRLAASSERPNLPWSFKLLDDDLINAFALPGGFVYITRGILGYMNSEAELAGVLGHEAGHVTARHSASQISRAQLAQIGLGVGSLFSETVRQFGDVAATGLQLLFLKYGRDDEREADMLGFRYMTRLRYDPHGLSAVMQMLDRTSPAGSAGDVPTWLSSHPDPGDRLQANEERIRQAGIDFTGYTSNGDGFLQRLDGLVFGEDPRQGYFLETRFLHPTLAFEITFPTGWGVANGALAVQAGSPGRDGAMQLGFAQAATAAEAAGRLRSVQGLTVIRAYRDRVNGLTAEFVEFDLRSQQSAVSGAVMYLEHGNAVYEVAGFATPSAWPGHRAVVDRALRSFARLTESRYLDVSPNRIQIVRLPRAMTFTEFAQQHPSSVSIDQVRMANQVVHASDVLPAGRLMKRIAGGRVPAR